MTVKTSSSAKLDWRYPLMKNVRKLVVSILGGLLLLVGVLMIILPGPAVIIIPLALVILNSQYPEKTRIFIKKFQRGLSGSATWMDKQVKKWG